MLTNLRLRFDAVEDRLTLRLTVQQANDNPVDHVLHLTRRVCAIWRQDLQAMIDLSAQAPSATAPATKAAISNAHHEAMASQAKVRTEVVEPEVAPNVTPVLVTRIVCGRRRKDGSWILRFERRDLPALSLQLSPATLHGLADAVARRVSAAGWGLAALPHEAKVAEPASAGTHLH